MCTCTVHCFVFKYIDTGWRRLIGCLNLQVIFRKRATNYRALWRKMTYKDKASYGSSPPCIRLCARIVTCVFLPSGGERTEARISTHILM